MYNLENINANHTIYIGRQPILNKQQQIVAYEILFRASEANNFPNIEGSKATAKIMCSLLFCVGLDSVVGNKKAFINFTRDLLINGLPELLPPSQVVVEILEDVVIDNSVIEACKSLVEQGYILALDDFFIKPDIEELLKISHIIKIDWKETDIGQIHELLEYLKPFGLKFLAEKVETSSEVKQAQKMGFDFFQGYFFYKPEIIKKRTVPPSKWTYLKLISQLHNPDFDWKDLENTISKDAIISYKLLRYINSAGLGISQKITNIGQAIIMLGAKKVRQWLSMMALANITGTHGMPLLTTAFIRAKFCEGAGELVIGREMAGGLFLTGLLSLLDAIMGKPMEEILAPLAIDPNVEHCLLYRKGPFALFLRMALAYEKGNFTLVDKIAHKMKLSSEQVTRCYLLALREAEDILKLCNQ